MRLAWAAAGALVLGALPGCIGVSGARRVERQLADDAALGQLVGPIESPGVALRPNAAAAAPEAVLLLHGWGSAPQDFARLPALLERTGLAVSAPLLEGHGTSPFDLERQTADDLERSALAAFDALDARAERVHVVGFSMGAALAALTAAQRPAASLTLVAPFFEITPRPWTLLPIHAWSRLLWPIVRFVPGRDSPTWRYDWLPVRGVPRLVELGHRASTPELLAGLRLPALFVVSSGDSAASPAASVAAFEALGSTDARLAFVHDSDHVLFHQGDAALVERLCLDFLAEQRSDPPLPPR